MNTFNEFNIKKQLRKAVDGLGFEKPTPIQQASYATILAGSDFVGIAQTGTGKTIAYLLPVLQDLKFSEQPQPRVLILVPTRELVIQIVEQIEKLTPYLSVRVLGVYGGSNNIVGQKQALSEGVDVIVGTPRRLYDLALSNLLRLKFIKKLVIDEVDIMLDFGYKTQLKNIFELLPLKRQNILFSATMTSYVDELTDGFLINPVKKTISISGKPLDNISQECYSVPNFYTKANLVKLLLKDKTAFSKVLVFVGTKTHADALFELLGSESDVSIIHSGKEQNHRTRSIEKFADGTSNVLIATDVIARGIDIEKITAVISFNTPFYPENYIHRIGRTGRAKQKGRAVLFYTEKERGLKETIEGLMNYTIPLRKNPEGLEVSHQLTPEEKEKPIEEIKLSNKSSLSESGASFHEKSAKNSKVKSEKKSYKKTLKEKFKKPIRRGDKIQNMKKKRKK